MKANKTIRISLRANGEWKDTSMTISSKPYYSWMKSECSICGNIIKLPPYAKLYRYCPHCGAKMKE